MKRVKNTIHPYARKKENISSAKNANSLWTAVIIITQVFVPRQCDDTVDVKNNSCNCLCLDVTSYAEQNDLRAKRHVHKPLAKLHIHATTTFAASYSPH